MNRLRLRLVSTLTLGISFALFAGLARVNAAVIFVKADADGNNDGTSWENAFTDLQDALAASEGGDQIWVAAATYNPDGPGGDRTATFQLISGVGLYGGFAGGETELDERDPDLNVTILSGDLNGDDRLDFANNEENSYHVVTGSDTGGSASRRV
ncbi:MAG: hypothetical protein IID37_10810 [Planctomycetes bacterium]|nr:hypothetical protein [Planctomycetota bacterium]